VLPKWYSKGLIIQAHDVSEYLMFIAGNKVPDTKVILALTIAICATFYPVSYFFTKYHYVNCYSRKIKLLISDRFEVYAVKNGGYKKFREKMFKTHKVPGNWHGNFS
jgi:hypothetical protein